MSKKTIGFLLVWLLAPMTVFAADKPQELSLNLAKMIAVKAALCGQKHGLKFSIAIVNSEGNLIYFQREDGTYVGSINSSIEKAKSANAYERPTAEFSKNMREGKIGVLSGAGVVAIEGGWPLTLSGRHVGAIGVSGAKAIEDERCAKQAFE